MKSCCSNDVCNKIKLQICSDWLSLCAEFALLGNTLKWFKQAALHLVWTVFFEWMIFLGCRVHMGQEGSPGLLRGIFRGRSYLNSRRPETQSFTLPGQVLKRESAGIMGTDRAVEPKGSRGDLTVWLGGPLTVRQDQDHQQVYFHWYLSCCHTHLLKKKNMNTPLSS